MQSKKVAILHYSAPPIIGGVEMVIKAHLKEFLRAGYSCSIIAGRGQADALPADASYIELPEIDSQHPDILRANRELEMGRMPDNYKALETKIINLLDPILTKETVIFKHPNPVCASGLFPLPCPGASEEY